MHLHFVELNNFAPFVILSIFLYVLQFKIDIT